MERWRISFQESMDCREVNRLDVWAASEYSNMELEPYCP